MTDAEELVQLLANWKQKAEQARASLRVAEAVIPALEEALEKLDRDSGGSSLVELAQQIEGASKGETDEAPQRPAAQAGPPKRLVGQCEEQVEQALRLKHPQSPEDLVEFLRVHGRAYSRGAINYAVRALRDRGTIQEVEKRGNLRFYELVEREG
jgi:hypothetical protein